MNARKDLSDELRSRREIRRRAQQAEAEQEQRDKLVGVVTVVVLTLTWVGALVAIGHRLLGH